MANIDVPEGFAFILDERANEIALRIEDHREDPFFDGHLVDESGKSVVPFGLWGLIRSQRRSTGRLAGRRSFKERPPSTPCGI